MWRPLTVCPPNRSWKITMKNTGSITVKKTDAGLRQKTFWS